MQALTGSPAGARPKPQRDRRPSGPVHDRLSLSMIAISEDGEDETVKRRKLAKGEALSIGIAIGLALGAGMSAMMGPAAIGLGLAIGAAIGVAFERTSGPT